MIFGGAKIYITLGYQIDKQGDDMEKIDFFKLPFGSDEGFYIEK